VPPYRLCACSRRSNGNWAELAPLRAARSLPRLPKVTVLADPVMGIPLGDLQTEFKAGASWAGSRYDPGHRFLAAAKGSRRPMLSIRVAATELWPAGLPGSGTFLRSGHQPYSEAASADRRFHPNIRADGWLHRP
jgi:hypothetical protein